MAWQSHRVERITTTVQEVVKRMAELRIRNNAASVVPTARGGPTAHPLPGARVSTSERPDTSAVVSVRWKWRLQSGRALSSPGPLPPPSAMEAPEALWQRRGETDGGFICGIPWPPS